MIKVEEISKHFKLYRSPKDRLKEIVFRKPYHKDFVALENISFEIYPGQTLGIIGQNGAGKSTLLKIISGILIPDTGTIAVDGKITGLLELGTGFNADMTGLENIYLNGTLIGMTRDEIDRKKQIIIDFSELGEFINEPIKTYSSGMTMRLAFSIAIHAEPVCFLVDEALSVGDAYFQQKCIRKIQDFRNHGGSIVFVSHDMNAIRTLCDSAILLDYGRIIDRGEPKKVVDLYQNITLKKIHQGETAVEIKRKVREVNEKMYPSSEITTNEVKLITIKVLDKNFKEVTNIESGDPLLISCTFRAISDLLQPHYGIIIRDKNGSEIYGISTESLGITTSALYKNNNITINCSLKLPIASGDYTVTVGVANGECIFGIFEEYCLFSHDVALIKVLQHGKKLTFAGIVNLDAKLEVIEG